MAIKVPGAGGPGLERSCRTRPAEWLRSRALSDGLELLEAWFPGHGFDPHRHDTYAIGYTLLGVQSFRYRGTAQHSIPGQVFVLHPDELHDGHAGSEAGFRYRIVYIEPALIQEALGPKRGTLPFVRAAVSNNARLRAAILPALEDLARPLEELQRDQLILDLAEALAAADPSAGPRPSPARHWPAVTLARALLEERLEGSVASRELEAATGLSRYDLARQFRACLGTSPYRYLTLRRLDRARGLIRQGLPLAEAAAASRFADQSHMTRHFKQAYGLPPGRWASMLA
ncbi:MAG TPA: AraC family transcriptional regulator [Candidatus Nitrosotalea sp.]|nr:AraC family transcriptional regulator [Candidatus Nitrosotalea sp.]